jgi:hypothetical protein
MICRDWTGSGSVSVCPMVSDADGLLKAPHCLDCCCHPHETVAGAHVVQGGSLTIARAGPAIRPLKGCVESWPEDWNGTWALNMWPPTPSHGLTSLTPLLRSQPWQGYQVVAKAKADRPAHRTARPKEPSAAIVLSSGDQRFTFPIFGWLAYASI